MKTKKTKTKPDHMRVVKSATYARGYSYADHLLCDSDLSNAVGRVYRSEKAARSAVEELSKESVPLLIETLPLDQIPREDIEAATLAAAEKGWGIVGKDTAENSRAIDDRGIASVYRSADYGPTGEGPLKLRVRIYRA